MVIGGYRYTHSGGFVAFFSAADDFWQVITFRVSFSRLLTDLAHVLAIIMLGALAELFSLYMVFAHLF